MRIQGHAVQELHPGDTGYVPGGVPHWHGAAPGQSTTLFSVDVSDGHTKWLDAVTDKRLQGEPRLETIENHDSRREDCGCDSRLEGGF